MAALKAFSHTLRRNRLFVSNVSGAQLLCRSEYAPVARQAAPYSAKKALTETDQSRSHVQPSVMQTVKNTTTTAVYLSVIVFGFGFLGMIGYTIYQELFSNKSANVIYSKALDRCLRDPRVVRALGEPIKAHGEGSSRGYRRYVSHSDYVKEGKHHMKIQFHLDGRRAHGKVVLEVKETESGSYDYNYLYVVVDDVARSVIRVEDNRPGAYSVDSDSQLAFL